MSKWTGLYCRAGVLCLLSAMMAGGLAYGAAVPSEEREVSYPVQVTISTGTCSVTVSPQSPPPVNALDRDMATGGVHGGIPVSLMTTDCLGVGGAGKTPSVQIGGTTYDQVETGTAGTFAAGKYLFYNNGSSVKWAGFVLSKTPGGAVAWVPKPEETYVKNNDKVPLGDAGETCDGVTECKVTFWAGLACGDTSDCVTHFGQQTNFGALNASITFTFLYD